MPVRRWRGVDAREGGQPDQLLVPPGQLLVPPGQLVGEPKQDGVDLGHPVTTQRHPEPRAGNVTGCHHAGR